MKSKRFLLLLLLCALALGSRALAEPTLSARVESGALSVSWSAACPGTCTLTLNVDGWPMEVLRVQPSGSLEYPVGDASKSYSARLQTPNGCLTAVASNQQPAPTAVPTPMPTAVQTAAPTPALTANPTPAPTPAPTPRPTATPVAGTVQGDLASQVVAQVNAERQKAGLSALRVDAELTRAAQVRAREIVQQFSHTRPDGTAWSTVSASAYGENIAMGQQTVDKVMAAWMSSQGHRENILRPGYGSIGVCAYISGGVRYWVQLFGK